MGPARDPGEMYSREMMEALQLMFHDLPHWDVLQTQWFGVDSVTQGIE